MFLDQETHPQGITLSTSPEAARRFFIRIAPASLATGYREVATGRNSTRVFTNWTTHDCLRLVSDVTGLPTAIIKRPDRLGSTVPARQLYCFLAKALVLGISDRRIAAGINRGDHTTARHARARVAAIFKSQNLSMDDFETPAAFAKAAWAVLSGSKSPKPFVIGRPSKEAFALADLADSGVSMTDLAKRRRVTYRTIQRSVTRARRWREFYGPDQTAD